MQLFVRSLASQSTLVGMVDQLIPISVLIANGFILHNMMKVPFEQLTCLRYKRASFIANDSFNRHLLADEIDLMKTLQ